MQRRLLVFAVAGTAFLAWTAEGPAQPFHRGGTVFNAVREVKVPLDKDYSVVVTQFFHHGEIAPGGKNVIACTSDQKLVPSRVLQLGPGDFCRLAFETVRGQKTYEIYYGGDGPEAGAVPKWTSTDGLVLETRVYKDCNVNNFESVRKAFESSTPYGADYVDNVLHANNPFTSKAEPFLSRYSGHLRVQAAGTYGFVLSSQDCSFLLIDDKLVAEEPGVHRPRHNAPPGSRKDVNLSAGAHKFEYYHAATGPEATMVAAWEPSPAEAKPKPQAIPSDAFRAAAIGRVQTGAVSTREAKVVPDFLVGINGDVPLPDNDQPLIRAKFLDISPSALSLKARVEWDFGDGQTSETSSPEHVYLHPGLYTVKLTIKRGGKPFEMANRVLIDRPHLTRKDEDKLHKLDDYLPILATYNPKTLDAAGLRQLVAAYLWKIDLLLAPKEEAASDAQPAEPAPKEEPPKDSRFSSRFRPKEKDAEEAKKAKEQEEAQARAAEVRKYLELAAAAAKAALVEESAVSGDGDLHQVAASVAPAVRNRLGDSLLAGQLWAGAARKINRPELKAECEIEAADVAINDLSNVKAAQTLLEAATARLPKDATGPVASRLRRVWGDYHAMNGNGEEARKAYLEAEAILNSSRNNTERTAWQGAYSRSTEQFLKTNDLDRAAAEIHAWEREFPIDKIDGYLTLLYARYWAGREKYDQAVALAEQLMAVNRDSAYADQVLLLAAECEVKRKEPDRALATLHSLLKDYPGSPLVPVVRKNIAALESGEAQPSQKPRKPR